MDKALLSRIIESAIFAAGEPVSIERLLSLFDEGTITSAEIKAALEELAVACDQKCYELKLVASGYRFQVKSDVSSWLIKLWNEKPVKYSRAVLETLALIAYRQPVTRAEIEEIRGVTGSSHIVKTLMDREWIRLVGHKDVPGRPGLYATTKQFLDYFNLKSLEDLPILADLMDLDAAANQLTQLQLDMSSVEETIKLEIAAKEAEVAAEVAAEEAEIIEAEIIAEEVIAEIVAEAEIAAAEEIEESEIVSDNVVEYS